MKAPQAVSFVQALVSRGEEIKAVDEVVSYFCFYAAVRQVLETKLHTTDQEVAAFATTLLTDIEAMKANSSNPELLESDDASREHVLKFAAKVFTKAESATRTGKVTKATGSGFLAASVFLGLESVWNEISPETLEKIKYSKFQAARILKAIKNGEDPNDLYPKLQEEKEVPEDHVNSMENISDTDIQPVKSTEESDMKTDRTKGSDSVADYGHESNTNVDSNENELHGTQDNYNSTTNQLDNEKDAIYLPDTPTANPEKDINLPPPPKEDPDSDLSLPPPPASKPTGNKSPEIPPKVPKHPAPNHSAATSSESLRKPSDHHPSKTSKNKFGTDSYTTTVASSSLKSSMSPKDIVSLTTVTGNAQKHARYAISALNYDDIGTAVSELEQALQILKKYQNGT